MENGTTSSDCSDCTLLHRNSVKCFHDARSSSVKMPSRDTSFDFGVQLYIATIPSSRKISLRGEDTRFRQLSSMKPVYQVDDSYPEMQPTEVNGRKSSIQSDGFLPKDEPKNMKKNSLSEKQPNKKDKSKTEKPKKKLTGDDNKKNNPLEGVLQYAIFTKANGVKAAQTPEITRLAQGGELPYLVKIQQDNKTIHGKNEILLYLEKNLQ